jgi:2'-5' RNA ligase
MPETIRTFIAFELPENIANAISEVQEQLKKSGLKMRWVKPENIHLTIKFLGNIPTSAIEKVDRAITQSAQRVEPLLLCVKGLGVFPNMRRPRILWAGISGKIDSLLKLHNGIEDNLEPIGFPRENRPFKGHLTLGRAKSKIDPHRLSGAMEAFRDFESEPFVADRLILFQSELKPNGAVYRMMLVRPLSDK